MSKCLCYKCHFSLIRTYERKSLTNDQMLFALYIHCNWTNIDIIDDEQFNKKLFHTERLIEMTCNRFKEISKPIPFKGEISKKVIEEAEEAAKKQRLKDS